MRFNQLKRDPNSIVRKKLYKKGKCWVVASSLAFASGLILLGTSGMSVQADVTSDNAAVVQGDSSTTSQDGTSGSEDVGNGNSNLSAEDGNGNSTVEKVPNGGTEQGPTTTKVQPEVQSTKGIDVGNDKVTQGTTLTKTASVDSGDGTPEDQTGTTPTTIPDYNPDAGFVDTTNDPSMSGSGDQFTIPNNQIPDQLNNQIQKDGGISQSGMDGTAPYFITKANTVYFLSGTLDKDYTVGILQSGVPISKIDTSFAKKVYFPVDSSSFFDKDFESLDINTLEMNLSKADTSHVTNMSKMFNGASIPVLDLSSFDTSNVTDMSNMFSNASIPELNLSTFDTSNVTDMSNMFNSATIPVLDLSSFNTSNVKNMSEMFNGLGNFEGDYSGEPCVLNVSSFKGSGLTDASRMFASANVKNINMPYFTLANATNASSMFNSTKTDKISIPNFDGSKINDWNNMFFEAVISNLDISTWNMVGNTQDSYLFGYSNTITEITLGPKNKFNKGEILPAGSNDGNVSQWISIGKNGIVDDPALKFLATSEEESLSKYYDGTGRTGVKSFVPDTDIQTRSLNVPTTMDGKKLDDTVYSNLLVKTGIPVTLDVPAKAGYTSDKKTINATVTDDGITTDETINYVKIPASSGTTQNVFVSNKVQTIATNPDEGNVTLYRQEGQSFVPITDRVLTADSDWYTDQIANVGGENSDVQYYRIATNEWVKASQAYVYHANKTIIRTNSGAAKQLMHAEGTNVSDRALSPDTEWYSDITADLGEGEYYRVATNEFINKNDVTVIKNV